MLLRGQRTNLPRAAAGGDADRKATNGSIVWAFSSVPLLFITSGACSPVATCPWGRQGSALQAATTAGSHHREGRVAGQHAVPSDGSSEETTQHSPRGDPGDDPCANREDSYSRSFSV